MALSQRLQLRQSQALVMTPQLMQAIKLLQLSNLDLVAYVEAELERNPLLDRSAEEEGAPALAEGAAVAAGPNGDAEGWGGANESAPSIKTAEESLDTRVEDSFPDHAEASPPRGAAAEGPAGYSEWAGVGAGGRDVSDYNLEAFVSAETTLADWLRDQLTLAIASAPRRMIGRYLIDLVDEAGYLSVDFEATAEKLGTSVAEIEAVLGVLQSFDPPGICARDLAECLTLQLKDRDRFDPAMQALIARLDLLAKRDFTALKKICGVDDEDLADMIAEIRNLNPKPGLAFGSAIVQPIVPDVFVRSGPDGGWIVELNSDTLPRVLVNQTLLRRGFRARPSARRTRHTSPSACRAPTGWCARSTSAPAPSSRSPTRSCASRTASSRHGVEHLRPLKLQDRRRSDQHARDHGSRVTANKYMATRRGIFELKYFFTSAIAASHGGEAHSAEAVRHRIKPLIDAEPPPTCCPTTASSRSCARRASTSPGARSPNTARRMRIPSSVQRRREKQAAAVT